MRFGAWRGISTTEASGGIGLNLRTHTTGTMGSHCILDYEFLRALHKEILDAAREGAAGK